MQRLQPDLNVAAGVGRRMTQPGMTTEAAGPDEVAEVARILSAACLLEAFGHVSVRQADGFLITATTPLGAATAESIHRIDSDGKASADARDVPLETPMHHSIYASRSDVFAICRTHSPAAVLLGARGQIPPVVHGLGGLSGAVRTCDRYDLVTDAEAGAEISNSLGDAACLLIRGNGSVAVGSSLEEAAVRAYFLEERCRQSRDRESEAVIGPDDGEKEERSRWYAAEMDRAWVWLRWRYSEAGTG